jgi:hypothetical protein
VAAARLAALDGDEAADVLAPAMAGGTDGARAAWKAVQRPVSSAAEQGARRVLGRQLSG